MRRLAGATGDSDDGTEFDGQYGTIGTYNTPRSFAKTPFDIGFEIADAAAYIATLAPAGKTVPVVQWSGNTMPYEAVLRATRIAGLRRSVTSGSVRLKASTASRAQAHTGQSPLSFFSLASVCRYSASCCAVLFAASLSRTCLRIS
jgi:hypothetical protein